MLINDLKDGLDVLMNGHNELQDGFNELKDGLDELKDGHDELKDGVNELKDGLDVESCNQMKFKLQQQHNVKDTKDVCQMSPLYLDMNSLQWLTVVLIYKREND